MKQVKLNRVAKFPALDRRTKVLEVLSRAVLVIPLSDIHCYSYFTYCFY